MPRTRGTRIWKARVPVQVWDELVASGRLLSVVHGEIERAMWKAGFVKVKHGSRWAWFSRAELEAATKRPAP